MKRKIKNLEKELKVKKRTRRRMEIKKETNTSWRIMNTEMKVEGALMTMMKEAQLIELNPNINC